MFSSTIAGSRIPILRPRRPPSAQLLFSRSRPFTQNTKLLLVTRHNLRPQLPYLSQPHFTRRPSPLDQQVLRLLSTETKRYVKDQAWLAARWTAIGWTFIVLAGIAYFGIQIEIDERKNPTPAEWSFWTKNCVRAARAAREDRGGVGIIDWAVVGSSYLGALERLESGKDGKGFKEQENGEGIIIPDVGKAGLDITEKSWEWRAGYFEAMMGCAEAAEHLNDMVLDTSRGFVYPKEIVIGPSNPDPRPPAPYMGPAPLEENTKKAFDAPETFYMSILTGKGFSTKQRLEAAWKFATWLEHTGLNESAEEMYRWGIDIAKSALPAPDAVLDPQTLVVRETHSRTNASGSDVSAVTPNVLSAVTRLAAHRARNGDVASALPILLSVLRAHHTAPVTSFPTKRRPPPQSEGGTDLDAAVSMLSTLFSAPIFPPQPPSGDTPLLRETAKPTCEEAELMMYVGEILFATSPASTAGLSWTKQATEIAEACLDAGGPKSKTPLAPEERQKCKSCLRAGVANWENMLLQLAEQNVDVRTREGPQSAGWFEWRGWFGGGGRGVKGEVLDEARESVLESEMQRVDKLKERLSKEMLGEDLYKYRNSGGGGVWIG